MRKAMLVDDERLILLGLKNILDWNNIGVEIVETASNGEEAYKKFMDNPVDIIITDINMPKVTGLQLIERLKDINNKVKFIILSGHDEFSYARTAIKFGVENYILKPINEEELEEAVKKVVKLLDKEENKEKLILERSNIVNDILSGNITKADLIDKNYIFNMDFNSGFYSLAILILNGSESRNYILELREIIASISKEPFELVKKDDGAILIINSWRDKKDNKEIRHYYSNLWSTINGNMKCSSFVAIGDGVDSIDKLHNSYSVASNLRKYILTKGQNICIDKNDVLNEKENAISFDKEIERLNKLIIEKDLIKTEEVVSEIYCQEGFTPKNIYDLTIKILLLIEKVSADFNLDNKYSRECLTDIITTLAIESSRENIMSFIVNEIKDICKSITNTTTKYSPVVQQIINVVNERYQEELSIKTLADNYNINRSYLGRIFNKEVGISFSDYLNKIKSEKAKEFILNTNMKITDIAKAVGYPDTSYFYRKFKKYYGVCPSTLRELKNY